jgi:hypothetical protein
MKIRKILVFTFAAATSAFAQDNPATVPEKQPITFQVLKQRRIDLGDRALIVNRVVPPVLPKAPPPPPPREMTPAEKERAQRWEHKEFKMLFLSATVYDRQVTDLRWREGGREHRVFSNIDFNHIAGMGEFETETTVYTLLMGIGNESSEAVEAFNQRAAEEGWPARARKEMPPPETFSPHRSEYVVVEDDAEAVPSDEDFVVLDALHVYYDANKQQLAEQYAKREAENAARAQWLKEHPPVPQDVVVNYWRKPSELPKARGSK